MIRNWQRQGLLMPFFLNRPTTTLKFSTFELITSRSRVLSPSNLCDNVCIDSYSILLYDTVLIFLLIQLFQISPWILVIVPITDVSCLSSNTTADATILELSCLHGHELGLLSPSLIRRITCISLMLQVFWRLCEWSRSLLLFWILSLPFVFVCVNLASAHAHAQLYDAFVSACLRVHLVSMNRCLQNLLLYQCILIESLLQRLNLLFLLYKFHLWLHFLFFSDRQVDQSSSFLQTQNSLEQISLVKVCACLWTLILEATAIAILISRAEDLMQLVTIDRERHLDPLIIILWTLPLLID